MKTETSFHRIKNLKVTGGFLVGLDLSFSDGLNCVIGPRGTGKSTIQEMVRHALKRMPGREGDPLRKRVMSLIDTNLDGGRVELTIETKDGLTYTVSRAADEDPMLLNEEGEPLPVDPIAAQLFRADVFSQNEIESIAETPHYQLDLLDKFEEEQLRAVRAQIAETARQLQSNASLIEPLVNEKATLEGELTQKEGILEKLKGFARSEGGDSELLNRAHALKALRGRETRAMDEAAEAIRSFADDIRALVGGREEQATGFFAEDMRTGPNGKLLSEAVATVRGGVKVADKALAEAANRLDMTLAAIDLERRNLDQQHVLQELEFQKLVEKQQQNQARSTERARLEKQRNELLFKERRLAEVNTQINTHARQRELLLARLSEDRDRRFAIRDKVARRLNERLMPHIRVSVAQNADQEKFRKCLENNLRGAGIQHGSVSAALSAAISPQELGELARAGDAAGVARRGGINPKQATAVVKTLAVPEKLMELEIIDMEDLPSIELCDNGVYKNSADLSTGQKCTAILPILMFESANPLLIDQPEDNLDNSYVFDSVVASINQVKGARQLIFVTHNPNIPVLGDASLVVVMQSDGRTGRPKQLGSVDACRDEIINLLEGGKEAFELRGQRYRGAQA